MKMEDVVRYRTHYKEERFWQKIMHSAKKAGRAVIFPALVLYYTLKDEATPFKDKAYILGALGYFILPLDLIPDFIVGLGYTDDIAVMTLLISHLRKNITEKVEQKAQQKVHKLL